MVACPPVSQQRARVMELVRKRDWRALWEGDELMRELLAGRMLTGFLVSVLKTGAASRSSAPRRG